MGLAWSDHRERNVLMAIAVLDDAGRDVTSDSICGFIGQRAIDLGPLPPGASDFGLGTTKLQVLWSLAALQREDPPYITARPLQSLRAPFPDSVLNIRLTARGRGAVMSLREANAATQRSPVGFQPPQRKSARYR
jgi:hypothetical protein